MQWTRTSSSLLPSSVAKLWSLMIKFVTWAVVLFLALLLLVNILVGYQHLVTFPIVSPTLLRQSSRRNVSKMMPNNANPHDFWLDRLYRALEDEVLLTRNVRSKEHLWKNITSSPHFNQESGEILVFLGWVAYWVSILIL